MRKLILHVGAHKTGTSTIQQTLSSIPFRELQKVGVIYPIFNNRRVDINNHSVVLYSLFSAHSAKYHMNLQYGINDAAKVSELNDYYLAQMDEKFNSSNSTILISGEDISSLGIQELEKLKSLFIDRYGVTEFKVIYSVREHLSYLKSDVQESIKAGHCFKNIIAPKVNLVKNIYKNKISNLTSVFGASSLAVYSFEAAIKERGGLTKYFVNNFVPELKAKDIKDEITNESLSYEAIDLMSYINEKIPFFVDGKVSDLRSTHDLQCLWAIKGSSFPLKLIESYSIEFNEDKEWLLDEFGIDYLTKKIIGDSGQQSFWGQESFKTLGLVVGDLPGQIHNLVAEFMKIKAREVELLDIQKSLLFLRFAEKLRPNGPFIKSEIERCVKMISQGYP